MNTPEAAFHSSASNKSSSSSTSSLASEPLPHESAGSMESGEKTEKEGQHKTEASECPRCGCCCCSCECECAEIPIDQTKCDQCMKQPVQKTEATIKKDKSNEVNLLGYRVELKWSSGRWYRGTVCDYNPVEKKHFVLYDDGDKRWYHLPEMVFRFVKEEDEWIEVAKDIRDVGVKGAGKPSFVKQGEQQLANKAIEV